jgi:Flp pilus assembly pilin Flp
MARARRRAALDRANSTRRNTVGFPLRAHLSRGTPVAMSPDCHAVAGRRTRAHLAAPGPPPFAPSGAGEDHMYQVIAKLQSLVRRDEGQDLLEYALLVALIAVVAVVAVQAAGVKVSDIFKTITDSI